MTDVSRATIEGREYVAGLAEADGEVLFAREVRAGCWDHRYDVSRAILRKRVAELEAALAGVLPLTSYGPEGKSPPDELAAIAAARAALGYCPECGRNSKTGGQRCAFNARGESCPDVLRPLPPMGTESGGRSS